MNNKNELYEILQKHLSYDKESGLFAWKTVVSNAIIKKKEAGTINNNGYKVIRFKNQNFLGHRLAWYFVHGKIPEHDIDHINGNRSDNRIENLKPATRRENLVNKERHRNGSLAGANFEKNRNKWRSRCYVNRKLYSLGSFSTEIEAHLAYKNFLLKMKEQDVQHKNASAICDMAKASHQ